MSQLPYRPDIKPLLPTMLSGLFAFCCVLSLLTFSGCDLIDQFMGGGEEVAEGEGETEEELDEGYDEEADDEEEEDEEDGHHAKALPSKEFRLTMSDGLILSGYLYDPGQKPGDDEEEEEEEWDEEEDGPRPPPAVRYPTVILLHSLNGTHRDWRQFPNHLVKNGYAVLAFDLRGHGNSTRLENGQIHPWRNYKPEDWQQLPGDVPESCDS